MRTFCDIQYTDYSTRFVALSTESLSLFLKAIEEWTVWLEVLMAHVGPHGFSGDRSLLAH